MGQVRPGDQGRTVQRFHERTSRRTCRRPAGHATTSSMTDGKSAVEESRRKILAAIDGASAVTFLRSYGNIGDELIFAGTRQLLAGLPYRESSLLDLRNVSGDLALVSGGGAWCRPYHDLALLLGEVERRFRRVIVLPSSFDVS